MSRSELLLAAELLELASETFGNHGCNDMDERILDRVGIPMGCACSLTDEFADWNNKDEGFQYHPTAENIPDHAWMSFMAHRLRKEAEREGR